MPADGTDPGESHEERLYEEYLDAALAGGIEEPEEFLARHGESGTRLRERLEAMHRLFLAGSGPRPATSSSSDVAPDGGRRTSEPDEGLPFERLGEFRPLRELGGGGMGTIYLAEQESLKRIVALKVIRPEYLTSPTAIERFKREARALARLSHPNVVAVHGFGEDQGVWYTAMELVPGRSLGEVLTESAKSGVGVAPATAVRWAAQIARALESVHDEGILHRDVKPSNVRITPDGDAVLVDFGLARDIDSAGATLTEAFVGSPTYASPEQIEGGAELDGRTDVYSLGVTLYQAITGSVPFQADTVEGVFRRVLLEDPPPPRRQNPAVSRDLEVVVLKAVEKEGARRYAGAGAFADDLEALLAFRPIQARPPGRVERALKWSRRNPGSAAALGTAIAAVAGTLILLFVQYRLDLAERREEAERLVGRARQRIETYREERASMRGLELDVDLQRKLLERDFLEPEQMRLLDEKEVEVDEGRLRRESVFYEVIDLLRNAEKLDADVAGLEEVSAELYLEKLQEALDGGDRAAALVYDDLLTQHDPEGELRAAAFPFVRVWLQSEPEGAEVFLFRMQEQSELFRGGEHRMVPVPVGDDDSPVRPGTWALRVVRGAGPIRPHDLIFELAGRPIEGTVLAANDAGEVRRFDRLVSVDGEPVLGDWEIERCRKTRFPEEGGYPPARDFEFERDGERFHVEAISLEELGVEVLEPDDLAERGGCTARIHRNGAMLEEVLPEGLVVRTTAAPVLASPACSQGVTPVPEILLEPGVYLFVLRKEGLEELRMLVHMTSGDPYGCELTLVPEGTTPPGWVRIAGYHIQRTILMMEREVTCAEYLEFLNDPKTLAEIDASSAPIRFPREDTNVANGGHWRRGEDGRYVIGGGFDAQWPIIAISFEDAQAYAEWMTRRAQAAGLDRVYALPKNNEVMAAGGGFRYSYGNRLRPQWSNSCFSRPVAYPEPVMRYPVDQSVYGVYDLCGGSMEWLEEWFDENRNMRHAAGGSWGQGGAEVLCVSCGRGLPAWQSTGETGLRLVYREGDAR